MSPRHRPLSGRALVAACCCLPLLACQQLTNPTANVELQESLYELQDLLVQMREETSLLQGQVDSLQFVVARQDSTMRRMANLMGMPVP